MSAWSIAGAIVCPLMSAILFAAARKAPKDFPDDREEQFFSWLLILGAVVPLFFAIYCFARLCGVHA